MDEAFFSQGETPEQFIAKMGGKREKLEQLLASCSLDEVQQQALAKLPHDLRVLVIAEDWSGDVLYNLPVLICMARHAGWEVRIFRRDEYPQLIEPYRKDGLYRSIPVFVFFDRDLNEIGHWIERPAVATKVIEEESLALRRRLREAHQAEWRQEAIREIIELTSREP